MFLLEYNEKHHAFHNNFLKGDSSTFGSPLFSNGWKPVCPVPDSFHGDAVFEEFTDFLSDAQMPYEMVVERVLIWVMNRLESE